ncbi:MAG: hypothetical protein AAGC60_21710 [Acidobacteriota bacterium]
MRRSVPSPQAAFPSSAHRDRHSSDAGRTRRSLILVTLVCLTVLGSAGTPAGAQTERVLLVGDSWAQFMWFDRTLETVFAANGRPDLIERGAATAIGGSTAAEWATPAWLQQIDVELDAAPTIDVVQLTIGGNDFLAGQPGGGWFVGMPDPDFVALRQRISADTATVVDHLLAREPPLEVLISLYDYTNFEDAVLPTCPGAWNDLGQPTPIEINTAALVLQDDADALAASRERTTSIAHSGAMQELVGTIPIGTPVPPGDVAQPSPIETMRFGIDCFHLSIAGYETLGQRLWDGFYDRHFNGTLFADGFESGNLSAWASPP